MLDRCLLTRGSRIQRWPLNHCSGLGSRAGVGGLRRGTFDHRFHFFLLLITYCFFLLGHIPPQNAKVPEHKVGY